MLIVAEKDGFNHFEVLTLCPYDKNLINTSMLTEADRKHIDQYHSRVWEEVSVFLRDDERALAWLGEATSPLL